MSPRHEICCLRTFKTTTLVAVGALRRDTGRGRLVHGQVLQHRDAVILCVAESLDPLSPARLAALVNVETVSTVALDACQRGCGPSDVRGLVASALAGALADEPVGALALGCITSSWTQLWVTGPARWGVLGSGPVRPDASTDLRTTSPGGPTWFALGGPPAAESPTRRPADALEAALRSLRAVISLDRPVHGLYVATQGLDDEPAIAVLLSTLDLDGRACERRRLLEAMRRPDGSRDLAVAWAGECYPGAIDAPMYGGAR